jgi:hypothetical protein
MSQNIHCTPRIYIGDREVGFSSFTLNYPGNSQINRLQMTTTNFLDSTKLFNEEIKVYINTFDGAPVFRGFIKSVSPSDNKISITAHDPRYLLSGKDGIPINITEVYNYDGYSISQFLIHYIDTYVNKDKIYLGTDYISDTKISTNMKTIRGQQGEIYSMIQGILTNKIDDTDVDNLVSYIINIEDDGTKAQIIIDEEKLLSSTPSLTLSQRDGIKSIDYNRRMPPSYGIHFTNDGRMGAYQHGNMPYGRINETGSSTFATPAEATYASMVSILKQQNDNQEINLEITRGFHVGVGSIVRLNVDDFDIRGNHRITTKTITFSKGNMSCSLGLNRKPVTMSDYLE